MQIYSQLLPVKSIRLEPEDKQRVEHKVWPLDVAGVSQLFPSQQVLTAI